MYTVEGCKNNIKRLRMEQTDIQNRIEKQENNGIFDESLYAKLDALDRDVSYWEKQLSYVEQEELK